MTQSAHSLSPRPLKATPLALVEAAERLFGSHGIENVSLRQIRLEACVANNSAVSYHFDDREKLVRAIWEHRLPTLDQRRAMMMEEIHAQGLERDAHALMRALLLPSYDLRDSTGVHRYAAFFRHALRWKNGAAIRNSQLHSTPASREAMTLLEALAPDIPTDLLYQRLRYGSCMFFDMTFDRDMEAAAGGAVMEEQAFLTECIDMLVAICLRPSIR